MRCSAAPARTGAIRGPTRRSGPTGRFAGPARYTCVSIRTAGISRAAWVPAALPGMVSWHAGIIALGALAMTGILRLLAERQRRATLVALMHDAPPRTVVVQDDKGTGNSTRVWMGDGMPQSPPGASSDPKS
jgi:hypothetical protein